MEERPCLPAHAPGSPVLIVMLEDWQAERREGLSRTCSPKNLFDAIDEECVLIGEVGIERRASDLRA